MTFVVANRRRGFVMHDELHILAFRIIAEPFDVKIGIRRNEIENIVFLMTEPVFPTFIPTFHQNGVKTILGCKVDISLHIFSVGRVFTIARQFRIIGFTQLHTRNGISISPLATTGNHVPPYTNIFHGMNPRSIFNFGRFVEIQGDAARKNIGSLTSHNHGAPRRHGWCLEITFIATCIGSEMTHEGVVIFLIGEVHRGIISTSSLMNIEIKAIVSAHLQSRLHSCWTNGSARCILRDGTFHSPPNFRQFRSLIIVFLRIVVASHPPSSVIACHGKFCEFFSDNEISQILLVRKFVAKTKTIIKQAETNVEKTIVLCLLQLHEQLIIMVADATLFSPNRFPSFVERVIFKLL